MVTLRQLRYLTALVRHGHFGRAAESCAVTQPALSMQIRELERELKLDLLERRAGEFALTETGSQIAERAGRILTDVQDLVDFARHKDQVLAGTLRLGIIPSLAPYLLPRILPRLQKKYPALRLEVRETLTKQLVGELERGELDVMMAALPIEHSAFETLQLFRDPFLLAMSSQSAPQIQRISVDAIDSRRLILLEEGHCLRDQALAFCSATLDGTPASLAPPVSQRSCRWWRTATASRSSPRSRRRWKPTIPASSSFGSGIRNRRAASGWFGARPRRARKTSRRSAGS